MGWWWPGKGLGDTVQSFYRKTHPKPQSKQKGQDQPRDRTRLKHSDCSPCALCFPRTENLGLQLTGTRSTQDTTNPSRQCWGGHKGHPAMLLGSGNHLGPRCKYTFLGVVFWELAEEWPVEQGSKGTLLSRQRGWEKPRGSFCHCTCWFAEKPTPSTDHCFTGPFCFLVNVKQLAQETGGACILVDRGLKYTGIYWEICL